MISKQTMREVYEYVAQYGEEAASEYFDISLSSVKRYVRFYFQYANESDVQRKDDGIVIVNSSDVKNELEARQYAGVDANEYATHRIDLNFRADGTSQYKIAFVPKTNIDTPSIIDIEKKYEALLSSYRPAKLVEYSKHESTQMMAISMFDFHHGKQVWERETGTEDYDIHESKRNMVNYVSYAMSLLDKPVDKIILEVGGDFFNSNGPEGMTKKGTPQAEDTRYVKTEEYAEEMMVAAIDLAKQKCNEVYVMIVPGNHDADRLIIFSHFLSAWYRNDPSVVIDNAPRPHKAFVYGTTYLFYTHKLLPNMVESMASTEPVAFSTCETRIANVGHLHTRKDTKIVKDYQHGIQVVEHPSMIPGDAWSVGQGYHHVRQGLIRLFDYSLGALAEYNYEPRFDKVLKNDRKDG